LNSAYGPRFVLEKRCARTSRVKKRIVCSEAVTGILDRLLRITETVRAADKRPETPQTPAIRIILHYHNDFLLQKEAQERNFDANARLL
jgi:hypothetical protein